MANIELFLLACIETMSIMLIWNSLGLNGNKKYYKIAAITIIVSTVVVITNVINSIIGVYINYLTLNLIVILFFKKNIGETLIEFGIGSIICISIEIVLIVGIGDFGSNLYLDKFITIKDILVDIGLLLISIFIVKCLPLKKVYYKYKEELSKLSLFIANLLFIIVASKCIWDYDRRIFINHYIILITTFIVFIALNIKLSLDNIELRVKKKELENFNMYIPMISNVIDEIRKKQHDFKNHLNTIYGIIQVEDEKDLKNILAAYVSSLNSSLTDIDSYIQIKNKVIMGIIYSKVCEARIRNIKFIYEFKCDELRFPVKDYELSQILNNLIDNAFEAVKNNKETERIVYLSVDYKDSKIYIETKNPINSYTSNISSEIFRKGFSTKNKEGHGYGLYNVRQIVESYDGKIQLLKEDKFIIFKIIFSKCI